MTIQRMLFSLILTGLCLAQNLDDPARAALQKPDEVVRLLELSEGMTVADIGAGTGYFESRLSRAVGPTGRVWAVEIAPELVAGMRRRFSEENIEVRLANPNDPGLPPQSVDRMLMVDTWHHLENRPAYARTLRPVLKPTGRLVIVEYTLEAPIGPPAGMRVSPEALQKELQAAGYTTRLLPESLPNQYILSAAVSDSL